MNKDNQEDKTETEESTDKETTEDQEKTEAQDNTENQEVKDKKEEKEEDTTILTNKDQTTDQRIKNKNNTILTLTLHLKENQP